MEQKIVLWPTQKDDPAQHIMAVGSHAVDPETWAKMMDAAPVVNVGHQEVVACEIS